jgi:hypothetical protein
MAIERIQRQDTSTGLSILQLTSFPLPHWLAGCSGDGISVDGRTILLFENADPTRGAVRDLYRVNSDGAGLELLARRASGGVTDLGGTYAYTGRDGSVLRVPLQGGEEEEIARQRAWTGVHVSARTPDGRFIFGQAQRADRTFEVFGLDLASGEIVRGCRASYVMPVQLHGARSDRLVASIAPVDEAGASRIPWGYWSFSFDGEDFRRIPFTRSSNHYVALGRSDLVVTCAPHPANALDIAAPGDEQARVLAHGAGFWHCTADASGEWVVSDTNWPDTGLQLVHVPSRRYATLCHTGASGGHPQWTHAHPCLAPTAEYVLFSSDRTGYAQLYLAPITADLKASLRG